MKFSNQIIRISVIAITLIFLATQYSSAHLSSLQTRTLPDGVGKEETQKMCSACHDLDKSLSQKQDKAGWQRTVEKMVSFGLKSTDAEIAIVTEYLAKNYPADEAPRLNVNKADAIEFESILAVKRSQAKAIIAYREKNGAFKSIDDLKKVPGIEAEKIDAKKDRLIFE